MRGNEGGGQVSAIPFRLGWITTLQYGPRWIDITRSQLIKMAVQLIQHYFCIITTL